ncbi:MAG: BrnA antitoxin family protein [Anaerolineae bacterium]|nr:BrnA antitoxin family protein [Anaerolineae bacterium]
MKNISQTDWDKVDALIDEEIDTSDIPPLGDDFFANAELRLPQAKQTITIRLDKDVLEWYKTQGKGYQTRINAILRSYMETHSS